MRLNVRSRLAFVVALAVALWGCGDGRTQLSPSSPSPLSSRSSLDTSRSNVTRASRTVDKDGDGYDDGPEEMPAPGSETPPNPDGTMPVPVPLTVNIIGPAGPGAFVPNPLQATVGNMIVWMNSDLITHIIVLDDGTPVGDLAPGQSSVPLALATPTMGYHCTLHPSMVGQVTTLMPGEPVPTDPSQMPSPSPSDPYGDGYKDDYYLKP
jgi:plastocyanin